MDQEVRTGRAKRRSERSQLSLKVRRKIKDLVDQEAKRTGWTQGATAEFLIEKQILFQQTMDLTRQDPAKLLQDQIEGWLRRAGWSPITGKFGTAWLPPDPQRGPQFRWGDDL
jgi:hypothetical protein